MYDRLKQKVPENVFADPELYAFNVNGTDNNGKKTVIFTILVIVTFLFLSNLAFQRCMALGVSRHGCRFIAV